MGVGDCKACEEGAMNKILNTPDYMSQSGDDIGMFIYFLLVFFSGMMMWIAFLSFLTCVIANAIVGLGERLKGE